MLGRHCNKHMHRLGELYSGAALAVQLDTLKTLVLLHELTERNAFKEEFQEMKRELQIRSRHPTDIPRKVLDFPSERL